MEIAYDTLLYIDKESIRKADPVIILKHKGHLFYDSVRLRKFDPHKTYRIQNIHRETLRNLPILNV